jgi:predicted nucleotidyltransferase
MRVRIRDFLETLDGWIFAVADYAHPEGIRSILRYVPDSTGSRGGERRYRKLDFDESFEFLRRERPGYLSDLHVVPEEDVLRLFLPAEELSRVADRDRRVGKIASILAEGGVPREGMGITGSMLMGLEAPESDIDLVAYGPAWWKARKVLSEAKADGAVQELDEAVWRRIYAKRRPETGLWEFVLHERRKGNRGMIDGNYFDLLFTREWDQIRPNPPGRAVGKARVVAEILDGEFAFDSPAIFRLDHDVAEILCYSHTYTGQALPGETVEAVGVLEETGEGLRLVVGTTREARGEWIRSLTLLEEAGR